MLCCCSASSSGSGDRPAHVAKDEVWRDQCRHHSVGRGCCGARGERGAGAEIGVSARGEGARPNGEHWAVLRRRGHEGGEGGLGACPWPRRSLQPPSPLVSTRGGTGPSSPAVTLSLSSCTGAPSCNMCRGKIQANDGIQGRDYWGRRFATSGQRGGGRKL
jgi:hypothetical protein